MAYYKDLTSYEYLGSCVRPNTLNVGWLEGADYKVGTVADDFKERLWRFCGCSIAQTRGFQACSLPGCEQRKWTDGILCIQRHAEVLELGSAEIRVFGRDGKIYAAPDMIYHYIEAHKYQPPEEFIEAVYTGPIPGDEVYFQRLRALGLKWKINTLPAAGGTGA